MCMFCRSWFVTYLVAIVLYVRLRLTDSDYSFGIVKLFLHLLIMPPDLIRTTTRLSWKVDRVLATSGTLNIDVVLYLLRFMIRIWINDMTVLTNFERVSNSSFSRFVYLFFSGLVSVKCLLFLLKGQVNCKRFTDSDYPFGIFKPFLHLLIMPQDLIREIVYASVFIKNSFNKNEYTNVMIFTNLG